MVNYYQELSINENLIGEELKDALKNAQRKWIGRTNAPDLNRRQEAERKVALVEEAQKILLDEKKKSSYDSQLKNSIPTNNNGSALELEKSESDVASLIQQAWDLINSARYADAIMVARKATEIEGNNSEAWAVLGYADYAWNNAQDAVYEYKKAISLKPNCDTYYTDLGNIYLDHNMVDDAETYANKAMNINPNNSYNQVLLGNVALAKDQYDKAINIFTQLIKREPSNESYKRVLANTYYNKGIGYCYRGRDNLIYNVEENSTKNMIECMKKAKEYFNDPEYDEKIAWGEKSLKKRFSGGLKKFMIPAILLIAGTPEGTVIGVALAAAMVWFSMKPGWKISRESLLGR